MSELVGDANEVPITISDIQTVGLLDTGSMISSVSESFYRKNLSEKCPLHPLNDLISVHGAGGQIVPYEGYIAVPVTFLSNTVGVNLIQEILFLVVKDTEYSQRVPVIIGTNIIKIWHEENVNKFGQNFLQKAQITTPWSMSFKAFQVSQKFKNGVNMVKAAFQKPVKVEPNQSIVVVGQVKAPSSSDTQSYVGMIERHSFTTISSTLLVSPTVVKVRNSGSTWIKVPVQVTNMSARSVVISPKNILCGLEIVDLVDKTNESKDQEKSNEGYIEEFDFDSNLTIEQKAKVLNVLRKWEEVFSKNEYDLGHCTTMKHTIPVTDSTPFKERFRRIPAGMYGELKSWLHDMLKNDVIRESNSPWASSVVICRKKDNSIRVCSDMRKLNACTIKDAYPLPRIEETLDALNGSTWFCSLDLKNGYYQMEIEEEDKAKTAFTLGPLGLYEYNRLVMGLSGAPASFQRLMNKVMGDINLSQCLVYLDDIIVFGRSFEEVLHRLENVFAKLSQHGLKLKPKKVQLIQKKVEIFRTCYFCQWCRS